MSLTTKPLTAETWADFAALVEAHNGVWGGCWCMGFHPEGVGRGHTPEGNRDAKRAHTMAGTVHQILVYADGECVGWCQYGTPAELPNINNRKKYDSTATDTPAWRSAASSPPTDTEDEASLALLSRGPSTPSLEPAEESSRPTPNKPRIGRRSAGRICTPAPRSSTSSSASSAIARSPSGAG